MSSQLSSSDESDLNHQDDMPPYPDNIFMKYGGFERVRKITEKLNNNIQNNDILSPFFKRIDMKEFAKMQEHFLKVRLIR